MPSGFMTERAETNKYSNTDSKAKWNEADDLHISWCLRLPAAALTRSICWLLSAGRARLSLTKVISCWQYLSGTILSGICISRVTHCPLSPRSPPPGHNSLHVRHVSDIWQGSIADNCPYFRWRHLSWLNIYDGTYSISNFIFLYYVPSEFWKCESACIGAIYKNKVAVDTFSVYCVLHSEHCQTSLPCLDHILTLPPPLLGWCPSPSLIISSSVLPAPNQCWMCPKICCKL